MEFEFWVKIALAFLWAAGVCMIVGFMWLTEKLKYENVSWVFAVAGIFWCLAYVTFATSTR